MLTTAPRRETARSAAPRSRAGLTTGALAVVLGTLLGLGGQAFGQAQVLGIEVVPTEDPKVPPTIMAIVQSTPGMTASDFALRDEADPTKRTKATSAATFVEGPQPMAMVILIQGNMRWMGNETYASEEDGGRYVGAHGAAMASIDLLVKAGPPGSQATVLTYGKGVDVKAPWQEATAITGDALGAQREYDGVIDWPIVAGVKRAIAELGSQTGKRRVLVILGDGTDNRDIAEDVRNLVKEIKANNIEVFAIRYTNAIGEDALEGISEMKALAKQGRFHAANARDQIAILAEDAAQYIARSRNYVVFPGDLLKWDGKEHTVVVRVRDEDTEAKTIAFVEWKPPSTGGGMWWIWLVAGGGVGLIAVVFLLMRSKRKAREREAEAAARAAALAEARNKKETPDQERAKTMFLGGGGNINALPVVGWIVPVNGPHQFTTFLLKKGQTMIGTGGAADVVVQDQYMNIEHAEIISTPLGFTIRDNGSTNGTVVNSERVTSVELMDNDDIVLGQTQFRFKATI